MILSHEHKFIFIHVGKTGGTSVADTISRLLDISIEDLEYNQEVFDNLHKLDYMPDWATHRDHSGRRNCKHINARDLKRILGDGIWNEYFKFSFVRNPYDRLLSEFSMFTQFEPFKNHPWNAYHFFTEFLASVSRKQIIGGNPYHYYLTDKNGSLLVDFVGKYESLQHDFDHVCDTIGLPRTKLSHVSPTMHKKYISYFTPQSMEMVYRIYQKDFLSFRYPRNMNGRDNSGHLINVLTAFRYFKHYTLRYVKNGLKRRVRRVIKTMRVPVI